MILSKGELIIKFKEEYINTTTLESNSAKFSCAQLQKKNLSKSVKKSRSFFSHFANYKMRKIVKKHKSSYGKSTSRLGVITKNSSFQYMMVLEVDKYNDIKEMCKQIEGYEEIEYAEPNYILTTHDSPPNDTRYDLQDGYEQATDNDIDANRAWDFTTGNEGIKVGVIDNGVDYHNIDLGNGAFNTTGAKVRGGWDYINGDNNPDDTDNGTSSHGTPVAGIIGASRNNGVGVAGLAGGDEGNLGVQIIALKIGNGRSLSTSNAIDAIIEASSNTSGFGYGCHILNNSWGGGNYNESLRNAIRFAAQNNVVFVASKGNDNVNDLNYPSDYDESWVLSVGATDINDQRVNIPGWWGSNFGNGIDVAAPGRLNIVETTATVEEGSWRSFNGTSAAAPHVSGLAALILSEAIEQGISLHHEDVENLIEVSSEDTNGNGYDDDLGHGRINVGRALEYMNQPWEITHQSAVGGTIVNSTDWYNTIFYGDGLSNGIYLAKRHEVESTVTLPDFLNINFYVWGRGTNASTGWSAANPNYQLGFCDVVDLNGNSATLRTFIYEVYTISGQSLGWYPTSASNVKFAYTTLGIGCPENRNITQTISPGTEAGNITYSASNSITATNKIESGSDVVYTATNSTTLSPGFKVEQGAVFNAYIGGCSSTGSLKSANISQDDNNVDSSEDNTFSIKLDSSTINQKTQNVKVYPNPNKGSFTTEILRAENNPYTLEIYNSNGVLVYKAQHLNTNKLHINQISMTDGVYYLRIICGTDISTEKIIVN